MVKDKKPNLVFLMNTKLLAYEIDFVKRTLMFKGCLVVDPRGRSGAW